MGEKEQEQEQRATAWLSHGFEELLHDLHTGARKEPFDVVVVGSGYGGAVAAAGLAGCLDGERPISLCVLERGKEYLPGMFPSRMADLPGHVRFGAAGSAQPRGTREGLFDIRVGPDLCAVLANGLGGGSLINAGVMEVPADAIFDDYQDGRWPGEFKDAGQRGALYAEAKRQLGAADPAGRDNNIDLHPSGRPLKFHALQDLAGARPVRPAAITIAMTDKDSTAGVPLSGCIRCGDCATGCNHGAKESLDLNLLAHAWRNKAQIYTGATVLRVERDAADGAWILSVVHTDEKLRKRENGALKLRARQVVLAAGAFGSPEILLRSQSDSLQFSRCLGQRFSANGDMLAMAYRQNAVANAVADESLAYLKRAVGPTITGITDLPYEGGRHVVEELAVPGALQRLFEEIVTTAHGLHELQSADRLDHDPDSPAQQTDPCAVDPAAICHTSVLAVMGRDAAAGSLELCGGAADDAGDGAVSARWPELRTAPLFRNQIDALDALARGPGGGTILPNPLWQLLPDRMQFLLDNDRGPLLTVHPLGGCPMGKNAANGVVDCLGRVFNCAPGYGGTLRGLAVLDGSIVPASLGTDPALTITALALNAIGPLRKAWGYRVPPDPAAPLAPPPVFRPPPDPTNQLKRRLAFRAPPDPTPAGETKLRFAERMSGRVRLAGHKTECVVELTLPFDVCSVASLVRPRRVQAPMKRKLKVQCDSERHGELRVFDAKLWKKWCGDGEAEEQIGMAGLLLASARVKGDLTILHREKKTKCQRIRVALTAWFWNRGLRDTWQWLAERIERRGLVRFLFGSDEEKAREDDPSKRSFSRKDDPPRENFSREDDPSKENFGGDIRRRVEGALALASRGGEVRLLEYDLTVTKVEKPGMGLAEDAKIKGRKRLTYARRSNPWRQLMRMTLGEFPGLAQKAPVLELDTKYLAREHVPLFHIVGQRDQPSALVDLASLAAYFMRLLLNIHMWSFRRPDAPEPREPQRLPGIVPGLPAPEIKEIDVGLRPNGEPARVRLTRYRPSRLKGRPVALIHGYSASGTTFAHPAVRPNLAEHLCDRGRDVWILDLRTSSGMPTARDPWTFEDAGLTDIPAALAHIRRATKSKKLDVVAHCMGAAMLSMAVLKPPVPGERYYRERKALPAWIARAVLSQIGPVVVMSPANIFRAYAMSYLRHFLPLTSYDFRVKDDPGLMDQLIDRLLATQPYPEEEFDVENPTWPCRRTPFAGTRHRMDALYGQDFRLADADGPLLEDEVLDRIDDLFGPLSIDTVSQGIHFARLQTIATRAGRNEYVTAANIKRWRFPTLSIHGERNGLSDVATLARIQEIMADAPGGFRTRSIPGFGHQDSLIGRKAPEVFKVIAEFLGEVSR